MAVKKAENVTLCMGHNSPTLQCIGLKKDSEYFKSWSPFHQWDSEHKDTRVPYCKDCCNKIFQYYLDETKSAKTALYYTLMKIDTPFIKEVYEKVNERSLSGDVNGKKISINIGTYMNTLRKYTKNKEIWSDFSATDVDITEVDSKIQTAEIKQKEMDKFMLDWGDQPNLEDYQFLEYRYSIYTDGIELTPSQETLYRKLCLAELSARRKEANQDSAKEDTEQIMKLMAKLKIDNFEEKKDKTDIERILEKQIWEIENTEPAEMVDKEEYKDYLNIEKDWGKHILRAVKNLLTGSKDYPNITKDSKYGE